MSLNKEAQETVSRLQLIEQNMQALNAQKQQFQTQLFEVEGALKEVSTTEEAYKIVGGIMIKTDKETLQKELNEKKELLDLRVKTLEKQETQLKEKAVTLRESIVKKA